MNHTMIPLIVFIGYFSLECRIIYNPLNEIKPRIMFVLSQSESESDRKRELQVVQNILLPPISTHNHNC